MSAILYLYPKGTLLVLYYIDPKNKHYIQKRTHHYSRVKLFWLALIEKYRGRYRCRIIIRYSLDMYREVSDNYFFKK